MLLTSLENPCSVLDDQRTTPIPSWFLTRAGNSDPCYFLLGVPTPENLTLWWEPKRNTLYLEDKTQDASQHLNPFLNALTAAGFAAGGVAVSSQLLKDCRCSIMP